MIYLESYGIVKTFWDLLDDVKNHNLKGVKQCIEKYGVDINKKTRNNIDALYLSLLDIDSSYSDLDIFEYLIKNGADLENIKYNVKFVKDFNNDKIQDIVLKNRPELVYFFKNSKISDKIKNKYEDLFDGEELGLL